MSSKASPDSAKILEIITRRCTCIVYIICRCIILHGYHTEKCVYTAVTYYYIANHHHFLFRRLVVITQYEITVINTRGIPENKNEKKQQKSVTFSSSRTYSCKIYFIVIENKYLKKNRIPSIFILL